MTSSLPASQLNQCYHCHSEFSLPPDFGKDLVMTVCCYKIFHIACLSSWAVEKEKKACVYCSAPLNPSQGGKPITSVWAVFQEAIAHHPQDVHTVFSGKRLTVTNDNQPFSPDEECLTCTDTYPDLGICYLPSDQRFSHTHCVPPLQNYQVIHLSNLSWLTKELVSKYPELAPYFSPKKVYHDSLTQLNSVRWMQSFFYNDGLSYHGTADRCHALFSYFSSKVLGWMG